MSQFKRSFTRQKPISAIISAMKRRLPLLFASLILALPLSAQRLDLPTSKQLLGTEPGSPQRVNSLPASIATSPDGRYLVTANIGFGTYESDYSQSLSVLEIATGKLADYPEPRTITNAKQTLYMGLAFSPDGSHIYASLASSSNPVGNGSTQTGSGILVYRFAEGKPTFERILPLPLTELAPGHTTQLMGDKPSTKGVPFPAAISVFGRNGAEKLLVAGNLADDVLELDVTTGHLDHRYDLAESSVVPSTYPVALALSKDATRAFVALWNASEVVELDLAHQTIARKLPILKPTDAIAASSHPSAFVLDSKGETLYVALSNRDSVAAIDLAHGNFALKGYFDTRLPHQSYFGAEPVALALSPDGSQLYVANMASDSVAVYSTHALTHRAASKGMVEPKGFIPTEWMPVSLAAIPTPHGDLLFIATGKSRGTGPNNFPQRETELMRQRGIHQPTTYIATLLYGSLGTIDIAQIPANLAAWTSSAIEANRLRAAEEPIHWAGDGRIRHVIYIIKENRTYDQILGDLSKDGKPVGNGDPSLTMYGASITPNEHKLALQFGVLDNFFDSGEVSGDGHVWSNAAIGTDSLEKSWQQNYRGGQRTYDFEGVVANGYPIEQRIPDLIEPASGYLWGNLAAHHKSYYHFGEYIASVFCDEIKTDNPRLGPMLAGGHCAHPKVLPGENLPAEWGGGPNKWPWAIPLIATNTATKPELVGHFATETPDFNLLIPDQIREDIFERHLKQWVADRNAGHDTMPDFVMLRLANDHTAGTTPGDPTPQASIADNDLALGRAVEAISHSPYWEDTAFFILEDDAQNGADHVDAHRSTALVISRFAPHSGDGKPFVDSRFYSTVSVIRTMENLLGLPPMNQNDAFSSMIGSLFTGPGDQPAFVADRSNDANGLIYKANAPTASGARESSRMDFRHADRAPADKLNVILWRDAMGEKPVPALLTTHRKKQKKDDDD